MHMCVSLPLCMWRPKEYICCRLSFSAYSFETGPFPNLELVFSWLGLEACKLQRSSISVQFIAGVTGVHRMPNLLVGSWYQNSNPSCIY